MESINTFTPPNRCTRTTVTLLLLTLLPQLTQSFTITHSIRKTCALPTKFRNNQRVVVRMAEGKEEEEEKEAGMSFDDAVQGLKDEEESERMELRGDMKDEEDRNFASNKSSYDSMREQIRARTSDLSMEKSVTTAEAIKAATNRALAGESAETPTVDLSKFNDALLENPEDELTDEQKAEIDKVGQMNLWQQALEEFKYTRFPDAQSILKQAGLMLVIFAVTASIILKVDEALRWQYTEWGLIPRSGEIMDYSDLTLPEGFTDQMTDEDLASL